MLAGIFRNIWALLVREFNVEFFANVRKYEKFSGSSISRRLRGRSMYTIPRGDDEMSRLISRTAFSAPTSSFYQNEYEDTYGSLNAFKQTNINDNDKNVVA